MILRKKENDEPGIIKGYWVVNIVFCILLLASLTGNPPSPPPVGKDNGIVMVNRAREGSATGLATHSGRAQLQAWLHTLRMPSYRLGYTLWECSATGLATNSGRAQLQAWLHTLGMFSYRLGYILWE